MKRFLLSFLILTAGVLHAQDALGTLLGPPDDDFSAKTKVDLLVELAEVKPGYHRDSRPASSYAREMAYLLEQPW
ncbi:MAG: hypothetical protein ACJZ8W_05825 [Limisphaerales bacterium]